MTTLVSQARRTAPEQPDGPDRLNIAATRAEALFLSDLPTGSRPSRPEATDAIAAVVRSFGNRGCAAGMAAEYGDYPDTAVPRMRWALDVVGTLFAPPGRSRPADPSRRCGTTAPAGGTANARR
jgi:hypothetical protein